MISKTRVFCSVCLFLIFSSLLSSAGADIIHLKNGSKIDGVVLSETNDEVTISIGHGATVVQRKEFIEKIERIARNQQTDTDTITSGREQEKLSIIEILRLMRNADNEKRLMRYLSSIDPEQFMEMGTKVSLILAVAFHLIYGIIIGIILFVMCKINHELPLGIKLARATLIFTIVFMSVTLSAIVIFFIPTMRMLASSSIFIPFLIIILLQILVLRILYWVYMNLALFNPLARKIQIFISIFGLLNFPMNTVFNAIILYSLFRKENKEMFLQKT